MRDTILPINITGMILHDLASTWVGKLTYFNASYWNQADITFEKLANEYLNNGADPVIWPMAAIGDDAVLWNWFFANK